MELHELNFVKPQELNLTKENIKEIIMNLNVEDIRTVYCGVRNTCRCGCKGIHYSDPKNKKLFIQMALNDLELVNIDNVKLIAGKNNEIHVIDIPDPKNENTCIAIHLEDYIELNN